MGSAWWVLRTLLLTRTVARAITEMGSGGCSQFQKLLQTLLCGLVPWETTLSAQQLYRMLGAGGWDQQGARSVILTLKTL